MEINKIYNGDCLELIKELSDESINVILTDPPYLYLKNQKLDRPFDEKIFFNEAKRVLKKDGFIVLFGRGTSFYRWNTILAKLGFKFKEEIIWNKNRSSSSVIAISRFHETISISTKNSGVLNRCKIPYIESKSGDITKIEQDVNRIKSALNNTSELNILLDYLKTKKIAKRDSKGKNELTLKRNSVKAYNIPSAQLSSISNGITERSIIECGLDYYTSIHPTQKPVRLLERLINLVSKEGDLILDPFSGSGSTAIACIKSARKFIGFEIDKEYFDGSIKRISEQPMNLFCTSTN